MSRWSDRIASHPATAALEQVQARLDSLKRPSDAEAVDLLDRIGRVVSQVSSFVADADPLLVSEGLLNIIAAGLNPVAPSLEAFEQSGLISDLSAASTSLDNLITTVGWPVAYVARKPAGLRQAAEAYRRATGELVESLRLEVEGALSGVPALRGELASATATVDASVSQAEQKLAAVDAKVDAQAARLDSLTADYNAQFLAGETARNTKADTTLAEEITKYEAAREEIQINSAEAVTALQASASETLRSLETLKTDAEKLVHTIGTIGFSYSFAEYADQQKGSADNWGKIAVSSVVGLAAIGALLILLTLHATLDWSQIGLRALVSVPVFALFAYAVRESGRHRDNERTARRAALELAAIDPFLAGLEPDEQRKIKAELAMRLFAQSPASADSPAVSPGIVQGLLDVIKELGKH